MKLPLIIVLFLNLASLSFGQTPFASPTPVQSVSPEKPRIKTFGSSLEKYKKKEWRNFQNKQKSDEPDDGEIIRIKTDLVVNNVLVTDQNGKTIANLKKDDFVVMENGVPQTIEVFAFGENTTVPRSIVLIIDCYAAQGSFLKKSIDAAKVLADKLAPPDKMAIVTADVRLRVDFTQDKTLLKNTLDSLGKETVEMKATGGFAFEALLAVLNEMFAAEDRHPIIIFQGDANEIVRIKTGDDTLWSFYSLYTPNLRKFKRYLEFRDIEEGIENSRATIYSVVTGMRFLGFSKEEQLARGKISLENLRRAFGLRELNSPVLREFQDAEVKRQAAGQKAMLRVAELSGGNLGFIEKSKDAEDVHLNIIRQISNRYVIGYYPTNQQGDGKRKEVKIKVRNHPEYVITGRKAYFPQ